MKPLLNSKRYKCYYIDIDNKFEYDHWVNTLRPLIILYNYYGSGSTMPWLSPFDVAKEKEQGRKTLSFFHEVSIDHMNFDLILHQDPTNDLPGYHNMVRQIPEYPIIPYIKRNHPIIGSFGFGLGGKGFSNIVRHVIQEYDFATIRLNIPFAYFGDQDGKGAKSYADEVAAIIQNHPNIKVVLSHTLFTEQELLDWLSAHDINCFFYDENYGRGISGVLDYALAVRRPIAITKSWQFKHIWSIDDSMLIDNTSLQDLIQRGPVYLEKFHKMWNTKTHIGNIEQAFDKVLGKE